MADAAKVEETKADKFKRLAVSRTNKALDAIASIGGLANKTNYEYEDADALKVMGALEAELAKLGAKFKSGEAVVEGGFTL